MPLSMVFVPRSNPVIFLLRYGEKLARIFRIKTAQERIFSRRNSLRLWEFICTKLMPWIIWVSGFNSTLID